MNYFLNDTDTISFDNTIYEHTMTVKDIKDTINDITMLRDAVLMVVNPEYCKDADLYVDSKEDAVKLIKDYFLNDTSFSNDFINNVFNNTL